MSTSKWIPKEESVSNKDLPSITIRNLKPNTQYEARIAIYDDYNTRSLGKSTKTISVRILKKKIFLLKNIAKFWHYLKPQEEKLNYEIELVFLYFKNFFSYANFREIQLQFSNKYYIFLNFF